jgi:hypothetical protein
MPETDFFFCQIELVAFKGLINDPTRFLSRLAMCVCGFLFTDISYIPDEVRGHQLLLPSLPFPAATLKFSDAPISFRPSARRLVHVGYY